LVQFLSCPGQNPILGIWLLGNWIFRGIGSGRGLSLNLGPIQLIVGLLLLTSATDLFLGSASAKWAILAPVFVPMFMLLGYSPELTQAAYRVGDSVMNVVTPLASNFPLVLMFAQRYAPRSGIGTMVALMLPYSLAFLVGWTLMLILWMQAGWPIGPGAQLFLPR
ncbi:MAG: hypothetical protein FJ397_09720, partial [Verrucomicrobia bacterium]|nr:hypothetical protein [Verrucomicrobiota bacterium]